MCSWNNPKSQWLKATRVTSHSHIMHLQVWLWSMCLYSGPRVKGNPPPIWNMPFLWQKESHQGRRKASKQIWYTLLPNHIPLTKASCLAMPSRSKKYVLGDTVNPMAKGRDIWSSYRQGVDKGKRKDHLVRVIFHHFIWVYLVCNQLWFIL